MDVASGLKKQHMKKLKNLCKRIAVNFFQYLEVGVGGDGEGEGPGGEDCSSTQAPEFCLDGSIFFFSQATWTQVRFNVSQKFEVGSQSSTVQPTGRH
jgi:hypothetical protein